MATQEFYQPYSGSFSPGQYDIYPLNGYDLSLYNTYGTVVPYYIPLVTNTASIQLKANETVVFEIDYCIPALQNAPKYTSSMLSGYSITNPMINITADNIPYKDIDNGMARSNQWYGVPGTISSVGGKYPLIMNASPGSNYTTYSAMNQQSLHLFIIDAGTETWDDDKILNSNNILRKQQLPLIENGTGQISYIATNQVNVRVALVYKGSLVWRNSYKTVLFKDFKISKYKQVTQVSDKGLLVFNNPAQYIKFTAVGANGTTKSEAVMAIDTLYARKVYADSYYGGNVGGGDKGGGTAGGGGIQGLQYDGDTIISQHTISAPAFSGSGFYLPEDYVPTTAFGHYSAGSPLLKGKNLLQAIQSAFMYQSPKISRTSVAPSITWGNDSDKFITTAMNEEKTWGDTYQLPAKFATTTLSVTYSGVSWEYENQDNIDWSTIVNARLTSSIASEKGTMQSHTVLPATYFSSSTTGLAYSRDPVSYSVKFPAFTPVASSRDQSATLTPQQVWSGVKDTLQNDIAVPSGLVAGAKSKTTKNLGRYGSRFLLAKRKSASDNDIQWKACNAASRTDITAIGNWTTFDQAFEAAIPFTTSTTAGINTLDLSFGNIFAGASADTPISIFLIAPNGTNIYKTTTPIKGRYKNSDNANVECYLMGSSENKPGGTASHTTLTPFYLYGLHNVETDPKLACAQANGSYTRTWPNQLTSTTKLFFITALTTEASSYPLTWDAS